MSQTGAGQPELAAARLLLERMGISPADLLDVRSARPPPQPSRSTCRWWPPR